MTIIKERSIRIIDVWNETVRLVSRIKFFPYRREIEEDVWRTKLNDLKSRREILCAEIPYWRLSQEIDRDEVNRAINRTWLAYQVTPGIDFEVLCANIKSLLDEIELEIIKEEIEEIGIDTITGYKILYDKNRRKYILFEDRKTFEKLGIILTYSIDTGGMGAKEQLVSEISAWTFVKEMDKEQINYVERELSSFIITSLENNFGLSVASVAIKGGVEFASKGNISVRVGSILSVSLRIVDYPRKELIMEYYHANKKTRTKTHANRKLTDYE